MLSEYSKRLVWPILLPLDCYIDQAFRHGSGLGLIGGYWTTHPHMYMSHACYIMQSVLPALEAAIDNFGIDIVAGELVKVAKPVYEKIEKKDMASFWSALASPTDGNSLDEVAEAKRNVVIAARVGIARYFGPILDLAITHAETKVFDNTAKFFDFHMRRMGEVSSRFSYADYLVYIELSKMLLKHGVYDWSIEQSSEEWDQLSPLIQNYGFRSVMEPITQAIVAVGHIPGVKDVKYHYAHLALVIHDLLPYWADQSMREGVEVITQTLSPIVRLIQDLHQQGAFRKQNSDSKDTMDFFKAFGSYVPMIRRQGVQCTIDSIRPHWLARLVDPISL